MSTPNPSAIAFARFGLGPRPSGDRAGGDMRERVEAEIGVSAMAGLDPRLPPGAENVRNWRAAHDALKARKMQLAAAAAGQMAAEDMPAPPPAAAGAPPRWVRPGEELRARLQRAVVHPEGLPERLALFWADYFTVSMTSGVMASLVGPFEREALRPHIFGPFRVLLSKVVHHPAMLVYLDNARSVGPSSRVGQAKGLGLNENLAREILELHTLGSTGGYTQQDVTTFAAVLSGWGMVSDPRNKACGEVVFVANRHEPGEKTLLGRTYPDAGAEQLSLVLDDLARHPATARHVATRLCRAFLSEAPPPQLVARMADAFRRTDGDLGAVVRVMVRADEAWSLPARKVRAPAELVYVVSRLLDAVPGTPPAEAALAAMGQPYFRAPSPMGWPDEDNAWATADGIKTRLDWARAIAAQFHKQADVRHLMDGALDGLLSDETRTAVLQAESQEQALTLLIMSPELQRR